MEIRFPENENDYLVFGLDESFLFEHTYLYKLGLEKPDAVAFIMCMKHLLNP
jgi:hypothetical protein